MDAMLLLEGESLTNVYAEFKRVFDERGEGLTLFEFVQSFLDNVKTDIDKHALVRLLVDLFQQIDVNGDQSLEWSEFTGFCIEAGMAATAARIPRPTFFFMYDQRFEDKVTRTPVMLQMSYHPILDAVITIERNSKIINIFDAKLRLMRTLDATTSIRKSLRDIDTSVPLRHVILPAYRMIAVLMSNLAIPLWILTPRSCLYNGTLHRVDADTSPCTMHYDETTKLLLVGCTNGTILGYNPELRKLVFKLRHHTDVVLSFASTPHRGCVATSALDGQVLLWDFERKKVVRTMESAGGAIEKLVCVPELDLLLGLSVRNVVIGWDLGIAEITMVLSGHLARIKDMGVVPTAPPRLVTMDETACFKMWELAAVYSMAVPCIQTLRIDKLAGHFPSLCVFTVPQRLRTLRTETWMAEQQQSSIMTAAQMTAAASGKNEDGDNEAPGAGIIGDLIVAAPRMHRITTFPLELAEPPAGALYNEPMMCFVAVMPRDVLLWETDTGKNANVFVDTSVDAEITCSCFDDRKRKLYLGRQDGSILTINLQNGALMKQGHVHRGSVTAVIYNDEDRCLIAAASDGSLAIYDDEPQAFLDDMRMVTKAHPLDITAVAYSYELSLVITGDREGCIRCWDFQDLKMMADIPNAHKSPVTSVTAMGPFPYFVSADGEGKMIVWTSRAHPQPFQLLYTYNNSHILPEVFDPWEEEEKEKLMANIQANNAANEAQKAANAAAVAKAAATPKKAGSKTSLFVAGDDEAGAEEEDNNGRRNSVLPEIKLPGLFGATSAAAGAGAGGPPGTPSGATRNLASREGKGRVSFAAGAITDGTAGAPPGGAMTPSRQTSEGDGNTGASPSSPSSGTQTPAGSRPGSRDAAIKTAANADSVSRKMKKLMQKTQAKAKAAAALQAAAAAKNPSGPAGPKNTAAEQEEIMANLNKNMRMTVLVEQIMDDYAQKHAAVEGSFDPYNYHRQRNRKYRLSLTLEDLDDDSDHNPHGIILPPPAAGKRMDARTRAWRQRLRLRSANVPVAVTAMKIILPEYEDEIEARLEARRKEEEEKEKEAQAGGGEGSETGFSWAPSSTVNGSTADGAASVASKKHKVDPTDRLPETDVLLLITDDRGRMKISRLTQLIDRAGVGPVQRYRWPVHHFSYNARRRTHRELPGPVIRDELWFFTESARAGVSELGMTQYEAELLMDLERHLKRQQREAEKVAAIAAASGKKGSKPAAVTSPTKKTQRVGTAETTSTALTTTSGGGAATSSPRGRGSSKGPATPGRKGSKGPAAAGSAKKAGPGGKRRSTSGGRRSGGESGPDTDADGTDRDDDEDHNDSKAVVPAGGAGKAGYTREHTGPAIGMTINLKGHSGVGIATILRRRTDLSAQIMKKNALMAGVPEAAEKEAEDFFAMKARRGSLALQANLLASVGGQAGAEGPLGSLASLLKIKKVAAGKKLRELSKLPGDVDDLSIWIAHPSSIATMNVFRLERVRNGNDRLEIPSRPAGNTLRKDARNNIPCLLGYFASSCGADGRIYIWSLQDGKRIGELGNIPQDEDAIAAGSMLRVPWRFPKQIPAITEEKDAEASAVIDEVAQRKLAGPVIPQITAKERLEQLRKEYEEALAAAAKATPTVDADIEVVGGFSSPSKAERSVSIEMPSSPERPSTADAASAALAAAIGSADVPVSGTDATKTFITYLPGTGATPVGSRAGSPSPGGGANAQPSSLPGSPSRPGTPSAARPQLEAAADGTLIVAAPTTAIEGFRPPSQPGSPSMGQRPPSTAGSPSRLGSAEPMASGRTTASLGKRLAEATRQENGNAIVGIELASSTQTMIAMILAAGKGKEKGTSKTGSDDSDDDDEDEMVDPDKLLLGDDAEMLHHLDIYDEGDSLDPMGQLKGQGGLSASLMGQKRSATISSFNPSHSALTPASVTYVLNSGAPATVAASRLGDGAVAVLSMSGFDPKGVPAAKSITRVAPLLGKKEQAALEDALEVAQDALRDEDDSSSEEEEEEGGEGGSTVAGSSQRGSKAGSVAGGSKGGKSARGKQKKGAPAPGMSGFAAGPVCGATTALSTTAAIRIAKVANSSERGDSSLARLDETYSFLKGEIQARKNASVSHIKEMRNAIALQELEAKIAAAGGGDTGKPPLGGSMRRSGGTGVLPASGQLSPLRPNSRLSAGSKGAPLYSPLQPIQDLDDAAVGLDDDTASQGATTVDGKKGSSPLKSPMRPHVGPLALKPLKAPGSIVGGASIGTAGSLAQGQTPGSGKKERAGVFSAGTTKIPLRGHLAAVADKMKALDDIIRMADAAATSQRDRKGGLFEEGSVSSMGTSSTRDGSMPPGPMISGRRLSITQQAAMGTLFGELEKEEADMAAAAASQLAAEKAKAEEEAVRLREATAANVLNPLGKDKFNMKSTGRFTTTVDGVGTDLPLPGPGVFMPTMFGPYNALEVVKARDIYSECDPGRSGEAPVEQLRRHPFWDRMYAADRANKVRTTISSRVEKSLSVREFFALVFPNVNKAVVEVMVKWTDPAVAKAQSTEIHWKKVLPVEIQEELSAVFDAIDADGSGCVSLIEIKEALINNKKATQIEMNWSSSDIEDLVNSYDDNGNSELDKDEFLQLMSEAFVSFSRVTLR